VLDTLPKNERIYPVGRLDFDTTGALLLTNDGDLAYRLTHPSFQIPKTYRVKVKGRIEEDRLLLMESGIEIENGIIAKGELVTFNHSGAYTNVILRLREGRKREIKRMFLHLGHKVVQLHREEFAFLKVDDLPQGEFRNLSDAEVRQLKEMAYGHSG
jgi:23S rRNA pseudouridine2605 synthase